MSPSLPPPAVAPEAYDDHYYRHVAAGADAWRASEGAAPDPLYRRRACAAAGRPARRRGRGRRRLRPRRAADGRAGDGRAARDRHRVRARRRGAGARDLRRHRGRRAPGRRAGAARRRRQRRPRDHARRGRAPGARRAARRAGRGPPHPAPRRPPVRAHAAERDDLPRHLPPAALVAPGPLARLGGAAPQRARAAHARQRADRAQPARRPASGRRSLQPEVWLGQWVHTTFVPEERAARLYHRLAARRFTKPLGAGDIWARAQR